MIAPEEALLRWLGSLGSPPPEPEREPLSRARDRVCVEAIVAPFPLPRFDNAALDGYAVRAADVRGARAESPVELALVGAVAAGADRAPPMRSGEAIAVTTGARIPTGADAVVRAEAGTASDRAVAIRIAAEPGDNVRRTGEEAGAGDVVVPAGTRLDPIALGLAAALGRAEVEVARPPVVAILPTGDELLGASPAVFDANGPMLAAMVEAAGGIAELGRAVADDRDALAEAIGRAAAGRRLLLTSGGVSVGPRDFVRTALAQLGAEEIFWQVAMRPGKATGAARLRDTLVLALSGNPGACAAGFELFGRPAIDRLLGVSARSRRPIRAVVVGKAVEVRPGAVHRLHGHASAGPGGVTVELSPRRGAGQIVSALGTNAVISIPAGTRAIDPGDLVTFEPRAPIGSRAWPPTLAFVGPSGVGKTPLVEAVVRTLAAEGLAVAVIKHDVHGGDFDRSGKDTDRFTRAGAVAVALASPATLAILGATARPSRLGEVLAALPGGLDLVLVEGFKHEHGPKLEVHRRGHPVLCQSGIREIVAVATDAPELVREAPVLDLDRPEGVVAYACAFARDRLSADG